MRPQLFQPPGHEQDTEKLYGELTDLLSGNEAHGILIL